MLDRLVLWDVRRRRRDAFAAVLKSVTAPLAGATISRNSAPALSFDNAAVVDCCPVGELPLGSTVRSRSGRFLTTSVPELGSTTELGFRMVLDGDNIEFYAP
jgi:hypothetical protein